MKIELGITHIYNN